MHQALIRRTGLVVIGVLTRVLAVTAAPVSELETPIPEVSVAFCTNPPVVDGNLADACWQQNPPLTNFHFALQADESVAMPRAWMATDGVWLYIAFEITHPLPARIKQDVKRVPGPVHNDDSVELFLDPGADGTLYFHYMLNAANVGMVKMVARKAVQPSDWGIPWRSATQRTDKGWNAELAVPLCFLAGYGDLAKCRANLAVNVIVPKIDPYHVLVGEEHVFVTWAPIHQSFHEPGQFGFVRSLAQVRIREPFFPQLKNVRVERYDLTAGRYSYGIAAEVCNFNSRTGQAVIAVTDQPTSGAPSETAQPLAINGAPRQDVVIRVPVTGLFARAATVTLKDAATGETLQTVDLDATDMAVLELMSVYLDRSYYTAETQAVAVCHVGLPIESLRSLHLTARDPQGRELARQAGIGPDTALAIPLGALAAGDHALQIELAGADNVALGALSAHMIKRTPRSGCEWKIDRVNRALLNNGEPFFPFGFVATLPLKGEWEADIRGLAEAGFTAIILWNGNVTLEQAQRVIQVAEKYDHFYVMDNLTAYSDTNYPFHFKYTPEPPSMKTNPSDKDAFTKAYQATLSAVTAAVASVSRRSALFAHCTIDEPSDAERCDMAARGRDLYHHVNEADGYRPVLVNYSSYVPAGDKWTDWSDILCTDPYWTPAGQVYKGTPNYVARITTLTKRRADGLHVPTMIIPMAELSSSFNKRILTPQEQSCQTYLALIYGAKGLLYYFYPVRHQQSWDVLSRLAREMKVLGPVATAPEIPQTVTYSPGAFEPDIYKYPDVHVALKRNPAGGYVLLAANGQAYPVDASYRLSCLGANGSVTRLFTNTVYGVTNSAFRDRLEPYGVRAYEIRGQRSEVRGQKEKEPAALIDITVTMQPHPELAAAEEPGVPRTGRPGKRNILANPSFEESTLPGWPHYYTQYDYGPVLTGNPGASFQMVTNDPFHGRYCLQVMSTNYQGKGFFFYLGPQVYQPQEYVWSLYLRASRDGIKVTLGGKQIGGFWPNQQVTLTTAWQRYAVTAIVPPGVGEYNKFGVVVAGAGTVWVDAMQMEKGAVPTEFEP